MVLNFPEKHLDKLGNSFFRQRQPSVQALRQQSSPNHDAASTMFHSWDEILMLVCCAFFLHTYRCVFLPNNSIALLQTSSIQQSFFWTMISTVGSSNELNSCLCFPCRFVNNNVSRCQRFLSVFS